MKVERLKDKDGNYCYPLSHAKSTIYGNEDEYTVFEVIEKLKQRITDLENRPSGGEKNFMKLTTNVISNEYFGEGIINDK